MAPGPEVADDARNPASQGRDRLAFGILRYVAVNTEVKVGVHRSRQNQLATSVYHLVRIGGGETLSYGRDPAVLNPYIRPHQSSARQNNRPSEHDRVEFTHRNPLPSHLAPRNGGAQVVPPGEAISPYCTPNIARRRSSGQNLAAGGHVSKDGGPV